MDPKRKFSLLVDPDAIKSGKPANDRKLSKPNRARKGSAQQEPAFSGPLSVTRSVSQALIAGPAITRDTAKDKEHNRYGENGGTKSPARSLLATSIDYWGISSNTGAKGPVTNGDDEALESPRGNIYDDQVTVLSPAPTQEANIVRSGAQETRSEGLWSRGSAIENGTNSMQHGPLHISGSEPQTPDPSHDIHSEYDSFGYNADVRSGMILRMKHAGALLRKQDDKITELKRKVTLVKAENAKLSLANGVYIKAAWHIDTLQNKILRLQQDLCETEKERNEAEDTICEKEKIIQQKRQGLESPKANHKCEVETYKRDGVS